MFVVRLDICTTSPTDAAYEPLFALYAEAMSAADAVEDVTLNFEGCTFLHQNAVAFLGGLIAMLQGAGCEVFLSDDSLSKRVKANLERNGFLFKFGLTDNPVPQGNSIPFRQDHDIAGLMDYLRNDWLGRGWVNVSDAVQDAIATTVWEIYGNAFEHGASRIGVFSCGQRYPQRHEIALTVVDFGAGIPGTVRTVPGLGEMGDGDAIKWALLPGTTSKQGNRGVGLNLLADFIRLNRGRVEILSHTGIVKIAAGRLLKKTSRYHFGGTLLNIMLKQDERRYAFADEVDAPLL